MATRSSADDTYGMHNKTWLIEMEVTFYYVAVALVALALMLGNSLRKCPAVK
jgi:hypothetical protein